MPRIPLLSPESDLSSEQKRVVALIGYYGMVAMTLLAHEMPLPEGAQPPLTKRQVTR